MLKKIYYNDLTNQNVKKYFLNKLLFENLI